VVNNLCTDAAKAVPDNIAKVRGAKYQSVVTDWTDGNDILKGWVCLRFTVTDPQYYMYDYKGTTGDSGTFLAIGYGDLDGNGTTSSFTLKGQVTAGTVYVSPALIEDAPEE
jgi:type IV pilus assembly protein PilA